MLVTPTAKKSTPRPRALARVATLTLLAASTASVAWADDTPSGERARPAFDAITLPGDRVFPESITSTADGTLYVGSIGTGGIVRIAPGSDKAEPWIAPGAYGTRSTFGLLADERAGLLWVCSNDISAIGVQVTGETQGSWLKGFDLRTGEGKVSAKFPNATSLCNEIAIGPDGGVYATNTMAPEILRLSDDRQTLDIWATSPDLPQPDEGPGLDGIAFGSDGHAYVNSYGKGEMFRVAVNDGKAGKVTRLTPSRALVMPDTIRHLHGTTFVMVEGGGRLDRITIDGDTVAVETLAEGFDLPTSVTVVGAKAWVAEGQLDHVFDAAAKTTPPALPFRAYAVPLLPARDDASQTR